MDVSLGESGWNPETSAALPPRRSPPRIPFLSGEWSSASWPAGTTTVVPTGQGTVFSDELLVVCRADLNVSVQPASSCSTESGL